MESSTPASVFCQMGGSVVRTPKRPPLRKPSYNLYRTWEETFKEACKLCRHPFETPVPPAAHRAQALQPGRMSRAGPRCPG